MFASCSATLPVLASQRDKKPAKQRADARIRTADPFITSDDPEGPTGHRSPPKSDGEPDRLDFAT